MAENCKELSEQMQEGSGWSIYWFHKSAFHEKSGKKKCFQVL